jgi:hypothetical protein
MSMRIALLVGHHRKPAPDELAKLTVLLASEEAVDAHVSTPEHSATQHAK